MDHWSTFAGWDWNEQQLDEAEKMIDEDMRAEGYVPAEPEEPRVP